MHDTDFLSVPVMGGEGAARADIQKPAWGQIHFAQGQTPWLVGCVVILLQPLEFLPHQEFLALR